MNTISINNIITVICFSAFFSSPALYANDNREGGSAEYFQSTVSYDIPDVKVIRQDGKEVSFINEMDDGRPVLVNFIFTSCSTICPMLTHLFSKVQNKLEGKDAKFHLVSISIDPENDTPTKLTEYAKKFHAGKNWDLYTGSINNTLAIQKALNVYRGDKMNHSSFVLMRSSADKPWHRLEGFLSPGQVVGEFEKMVIK